VPGNLRTTITLKTNIPEQGEVTVDVNGMVPDRLEIQPTVITLNPARPGAEDTTGVSRVIRFTNYGKDPVKVLEATVDDPTVTVNVAERKAGENYTIQVQMPAGYTPPSTGRTITLKTDDKEKPTITVPIQGTAAQPTPEKTAEKTTTTKPEAPKSLVAKPAPPFKLTTIDGKEVSNESVKGSVAVLNFFAPNCGFCKKQIPRLETVRAEYAESLSASSTSARNGRQGIHAGRSRDHDEGAAFPWRTPLNHTNDVGQLFQASGFPTMVVLDKEGKVAVTNVGNLGDLEERMKKQLNALIDGKPIPADAMPAAPAAADANKPKPPAADAMVGKPAPAINLKTVDGKDLTNATFAEAPATVLDFFAVNCGYCIKQIPRLETVRAKWPKGIRFVAVQETMRQEFSKEDAQKKLDEVAWKGEWAQDPGNATGPGFGARGFPTMVIVNKAGNIEAVNTGNLADLETKVAAQLDAIIAGKPASSVAAAAPAPADPAAPTADKPAAPAKRPAELLVGTQAPAFSLQTVAGKPITSDEFSKHPATVLNFVAPNCGFCKKQIPNVDKVRAEYEAKGVRFVNVAQKMGAKEFTTEETVDVFKQAGSNLEIAKDDGNAIGTQYKAQSFPTMIVVGKDGKIEYVNIGAKPDLETLLKGQLDGLIAKKQ
jgi:thiol-disulfide isomerase/thioredoxin